MVVLAEALGNLLAAPVLNRTGVGIVAGIEATAEPHGDTALVTSTSQAIVPSLLARLPFDPADD